MPQLLHVGISSDGVAADPGVASIGISDRRTGVVGAESVEVEGPASFLDEPGGGSVGAGYIFRSSLEFKSVAEVGIPRALRSKLFPFST